MYVMKMEGEMSGQSEQDLYLVRKLGEIIVQVGDASRTVDDRNIVRQLLRAKCELEVAAAWLDLRWKELELP